MITKNSGCYYGIHFGCLCAARDPNCRGCAERLTNAVNYVLHPSLNDTNAPHTCTVACAGGATEGHEEKTASILRGDHNVWRDTKLPNQ